ncbi:glycosyltransferase family 2 protein [Ochrobactrum quorumnocens]|uniref:Glycosyltransferase family 2 protein n=1 Tax=Ochrobactrum quorumnocens TaxID=271865 RepID=A0A5N1KA86_9HYPH|nr:glycosyltransferase family 2 protein [[Ochrobactrum] quorumnocens]KAA9371154.1 glycosyltransferase family 2 protein [[Ochrobactrum] quorumnocens]
MLDVTVGIAAYNSAEFIEQAVESVLSQEGKSFEIIVVDDGSQDNTAELVAAIQRRDSRVRLFQKPNAGLGASRNDVIDQAKGRYIHFMDGDDYMGPNFLDAMASRADALSADVIISTYYEVSSNDLVVIERGLPKELAEYSKSFNWTEKPIVLLSRTPVWDKLYRREFIQKNAIRFIETGAEDIPFSWKTLVLAERIGTVWTPYFYYRVRKGSLTGGVSLIEDVFKAVDSAEDFLMKQPNWKRIQPYFVGRSICEIGYLLVKAREGFINNPSARDAYFGRLIEKFKNFDVEISPKIYKQLDPLYFEIYSAVQYGLSSEEMGEWFATHVSPYAQKTPKSYVLRRDASQLKAVIRVVLARLLRRG